MGIGWTFAYRRIRDFPVDSQWKFELKGFATVERATFPSATHDGNNG